MCTVENGLYTLTDRDQDDIDVFERLACVEFFRKSVMIPQT